MGIHMEQGPEGRSKEQGNPKVRDSLIAEELSLRAAYFVKGRHPSHPSRTRVKPRDKAFSFFASMLKS